MSELKVFADASPEKPEIETRDGAEIAQHLAQAGVRFERWRARHPVSAGDPQDQILEAYRSEIDRLVSEGGYQSMDVISLSPDHPDKKALRQKFLAEHTHSEDEVRFFVAGRGLFSLHIGARIYEVLCEADDLISVPAGTPHWFDMGPNPNFAAIRLFNNPDGWVAHFTGNPIAERFSRLEN